MSMQIRAAQASDLTMIETMLSEAGLPYQDVNRHLKHFIVATGDNGFVGVGGLEIYSGVALVRSMVVTPASRGAGVGQRIFQSLVKRARTSGVNSLYLLTDTAEEYFKRFGFRSLTRSAVPMAIKKTEQFAHLCPDSASVMMVKLDELK